MEDQLEHACWTKSGEGVGGTPAGWFAWWWGGAPLKERPWATVSTPQLGNCGLGMLPPANLQELIHCSPGPQHPSHPLSPLRCQFPTWEGPETTQKQESNFIFNTNWSHFYSTSAHSGLQHFPPLGKLEAASPCTRLGAPPLSGFKQRGELEPIRTLWKWWGWVETFHSPWRGTSISEPLMTKGSHRRLRQTVLCCGCGRGGGKIHLKGKKALLFWENTFRGF